LYPDYDFFDLRIDILRQQKPKDPNNMQNTNDWEEYRTVGFNLGNAMFYDLNKNISLSVLELLNVNRFGDFTIAKQDYRTGKIISRFTKNNNIYKKESYNLILNITNSFDMFLTDSLVIVNNGILFKSTINITKDLFTFKSGLTTYNIERQTNGWFLKALIGGTQFTLVNNSLFLEYLYTIENTGEQIFIYNGKKFKNSVPFITLEKSDNELYIYNRYYAGTKIYFETNKITIEENGIKEYSYFLE